MLENKNYSPYLSHYSKNLWTEPKPILCILIILTLLYPKINKFASWIPCIHVKCVCIALTIFLPCFVVISNSNMTFCWINKLYFSCPINYNRFSCRCHPFSSTCWEYCSRHAASLGPRSWISQLWRRWWPRKESKFI